MNKLSILAFALVAIFFTSCDKDDDEPVNGDLMLNLSGLEELGSDYKYEGWLIVNGTPVSTGTFSSVTFPQSFVVDKSTLDAASKFVLTIEPTNDTDPAPSATKMLAGDFSGNSANVSTQNMLGDLTATSGKFIMATPTDGANNNEESGVWFLDNSSGSPAAGLILPTLPAGWKYEGWVVINGTPISTGTFTAVNTADDNATTSPYKGTVNDGPPYPGEDYVTGSITNINFPIDLKEKTIVISVEPNPDNSSAPFTIKPLAKMIPSDANVHSVIEMGQGPIVEISGTVTK